MLAATGAACPADLNGDHQIDDADFVEFAAAYNQLLCRNGIGKSANENAAG